MALSWMLERQFPAHFSRPEVQLNIQNNLAVSQNGSSNFESVVVRDLEYSRLRQHPEYEHHKVERLANAREVESERVPEELSGCLTKPGHGGTVISESQRDQIERRSQKASERIESLLKARLTGVNPEPGSRSEASSVMDDCLGNERDDGNVHVDENTFMAGAMITLPTSEPTSAWWSRLASGDPARLISKDAAVFAIRFIAGGQGPVEFAEALLPSVMCWPPWTWLGA